MHDLSTHAKVRYLIPGEEKPVYFASQGGAEAQLSINAEFEDVEVAIHDARCLNPAASLDKEGFELHSHKSNLSDFYAIENQKSEYEAELAELVLPLVGGNSLYVFDHTLRSDSAEVRAAHNIREAAAIVHNDYTHASAHKRVRDLLDKKEAENKLNSRFIIVNVWRTIAGPAINSPLTCCDAQSVTEENVFASERRAKDRIGELELVSNNPGHRWYYYPEMNKGEVLLIKTFDSASDGRATRSVHTAFENPLAAEDAEARESMESRMLVFF
ncbi:MAG: methyltransferase [Pseudomonadales bacterium]|nr:methyltransferase [Pseudomonadales bacterium]